MNANVNWSMIVATLLAIWLAAKVITAVGHSSGRWPGRLAILVLAGLAVFGWRSAYDEQNDGIAATPVPAAPKAAWPLGPLTAEPPSANWPLTPAPPQSPQWSPPEFSRPPFESFVTRRSRMWSILSVVAVLGIAGLLLSRRRRDTQPATVKLLTLVAAGVLVFSLASFFSSPPRESTNHDRVVRVVSREKNEPQVRIDEDERPREAPERPRRARRPLRVKAPAGGSAATKTVASSDELPPRAGEIPVAAELAKAETPVATPPSLPATPAVAALPAEAPAVTTPPATPVVSQPSPPAAPAVPSTATAASEPAAPPKIENVPPAVQKTAPAAVAPSKPTGEPRPAWVDAAPSHAKGVYSVSVKSGLFSTVPECQREIDARIKEAADEYIDEYLLHRAPQASGLVEIPLEYLKKHVQHGEYSEIVTSESVGAMHQIHALLEFDDEARAEFQRRWHDVMVTNRLWYAGSGAALVLGLLGTFYGYLRVDEQTSGSRRGVLQLAATLVALIVAAGALLLRSAVPF